MQRCTVLSHPACLQRTGLLNVGLEPAYDRLTRLAAMTLRGSVALLSLVQGGRRIFKSCSGRQEPIELLQERPLAHSVCQWILEQRAPLAISDARQDSRAQGDPVLQELGGVAYLGVPLVTPDDLALGALCVLDREPRDWSAEEIALLQDLAAVVTSEIQHRWTAAELGKSEHRFRQLCDMAPVGIFQTDAHGRCTFVNEQWKRFTGLTLEQAMGDGWASTLHQDFAEVYDRWRKVAPTGVPFVAEFMSQIAEGQTAWIYGQTVPLLAEDGQVIGHIGVLRDISVYKHVEEALRQRKAVAEQANEAKSRFLANMSHEVRTPLNGILGLCNMLLDTELQSGQRKIATLVSSSAESLLELLNDVLDFSKVESGHGELKQVDYDLRQTVDRVVQLNRPRALAKGLRLEMQLAPGLPAELRGDPLRLQQVLNNLVGNATKFSSSGRICISVELNDAAPKGRLLRFSVSDEGPGVPLAAQERIFDPFAQADASTTRRFGGTGLGLAICKQLVELMGGTITVQSEVGEGATFSFTVPYQKSLQLDAPPPDTPAAELPPLGLRVLLAEDNSINRLVAVNQLQKLGCTVDSVEDGRAAVDAALQTPYDLIFMDCHMPVLDGYGATREIRQRWVREEPIRIIALTANAMDGERERCLACGMDEYLSKPFDAAGLRRVIAAALSAPATPAIPQHAPPSADREAVFESLQAMEADGVDVQLVVELFHEEAAQALARVDAALAAGDAGEVWRAAHKLKGTAAEMGALTLRDSWGALEECGRTGNLAQSAQLYQTAKAELEQLRKILETAPLAQASLTA